MFPLEQFGILSALGTAYDVITSAMGLLTQAPSIYFVALALIGAGAGVASKFVPMRRR